VDASEGAFEPDTTSNAGLASNARAMAASRGEAYASTSPVDASNATRSGADAGDADESDDKTSASASAEARDVEARMATSLLAPRSGFVDVIVSAPSRSTMDVARGARKKVLGVMHTCRTRRQSE
jgi:hypothetical protein